ncbi:MAG: peptidylprolyl isomerase, partial [Candidatus Limnocylindria bacterium]
MKRLVPFIGLALALVACGTDPTPTPAPACPAEAPTSVSAQATLEGAELATLRIGGAVEGELLMELYGDKAPIATASFVELARCGFYDGVTFHRVIAGFVIQAGDPQTVDNRGDFQGLGAGGPDYDFEIEPPADGLRYDRYVVAMANDTRTNGSQFFIDLVDLDQQLRAVGVYTIFG